MTAAPEHAPAPQGPPFATPSPAEVRAGLTPEDAVEFDRSWRVAMAAATEALDLTGVYQVLESWRRIAWLTSAHGVDGYRRLMARAEETLRTEKPSLTATSAQEMKAALRRRLN